MFFVRHVLPVAILSAAVGFVVLLYSFEPEEFSFEWLKTPTHPSDVITTSPIKKPPTEAATSIPKSPESKILATETPKPVTDIEEIAEEIKILAIEDVASEETSETALPVTNGEIKPAVTERAEAIIAESDAIPEAKKYSEYTVKSGDSLSSISNKVYGSPHKYQRIINANRERLPNPNKLRLGQTLRIPIDKK